MQSHGAPPYRVITARSAGGDLIDVALAPDDGGRMRVTAIGSTTAGAYRERHLDLSDHVLLPPAADPHAHLDKALSWEDLTPAVGDLDAAIECWRRGVDVFDETDFHRRARAAALLVLTRGTTAVRTHVDVLAGDDPYRGIRAIDRVRRELASVMAIEIVALPLPGTPSEVVLGALDAGADLVGGAPHIAEDPATEVAHLIRLAESRGVGVDLHTDEFLIGDHMTIGTFAELVAGWPADRTRTAGHCCRSSTMEPEELSQTVKALRTSGISVVTLPITNLYLQDRVTCFPLRSAPVQLTSPQSVHHPEGRS
ncbi:hypothetical protein ACPXB3_16695 [Gordonia sp. DT219]|uniref:hypothetical protein n=1 Tax=Gordonia sp. DT219 TaxID=3416658 RepID=UPI003CFBA5AB